MKKSKTNRLVSNGYGSFEQQIVMRVNNDCAGYVVQALGVVSHKKCDDYTEIIWKRLTTKLHDDEDVVFEVSCILFDILCDQWEVDWKQSNY